MHVVDNGTVKDQQLREIADLRARIKRLESDVADWREAWEAMEAALGSLRYDTMRKPVGKRHATPTELLRVMKAGLGPSELGSSDR